MLFLTAFAVMAFAEGPAALAWIQFVRTGPTTGTINWATDPSGNTDYYYFGVYPTTTQYTAPGYCNPNWNVPGGPITAYVENPPGWLSRDVTGLDEETSYYAYVAAVNTHTGWSWFAYSSWESGPPPSPVDFPQGVATAVDGGHTINPSVDLNLALDQSLNPFPAVSNPNLIPSYSVVLAGAGIVDIEINTTANWGACYHSGDWHYVSNAGGSILFSDVDFGVLSDVPFILSDDDPTLPVELSSFTATITAQGFVSLNWITQSETNLLGFKIYKNYSEDIGSALLITPSPITATNTSTVSTYNFSDQDVEPGTTYWYWLESVEYDNHSTTHSPISITVTEEITPPQILISSLDNLYPNPFFTGELVTVDATIKSGEHGTLAIYNLKGEIIRTFALKTGVHSISWDGRDQSGKLCGSGLYFCKLSTESTIQVRKLLRLK